MKKQRVLSLSLVCLLVFGLLFALLTCTIQMPDSSGGGGGGGSNDGGGGAITSLSGRYYCENPYYSDWYINFRTDGTFTYYDGYDITSGSYTVSGTTLNLNKGYGRERWTIIDSNTIKDEDDDYWSK